MFKIGYYVIEKLNSSKGVFLAYRLVTTVNSASPKNWLVISVLLIALISSGFSARVDFPVLTGSYLGQKPPGLISQLFAPEIVSTERFGEAGGALSKNGELFLFNRRPLQEEHKTIYCMVQRNGIWSKPSPVPFNSGFGDWSFDFGPDGQTLFFSSKRPVKPEAGFSGNIWTIKLVGSEWTEPKMLGYPVNTPESYDSGPALSADGTLYFFSCRAGGYGENDLYRAKLIKGEYTAVENLGPQINTKYWEYDPFVGPDEDYIIFRSTRPGGYGQYNDVYISFKKTDGTWTEPKSLGQPFCDSGISGVTHDGKYLFITNEKRKAGNDDIYWVDIRFIDLLKPDELK